MATTRIIPMHINKGKSLAQCLTDRTDYAKNPKKTNDGELVSSFMCDPDLVDAQFLLSKKIYEQKTGRRQKNDVIAYQVRQSFKPDEINPQLANAIGYQLAERITKGNHAFIVATHIDRSHIHNHIIWNSTALDSKKKFRNFWNSTTAIRKISDLLCLENGLSIVENPSKKSQHYGQWLEGEKPLTLSDKLRLTIDNTLAGKPVNFDDFLKQMRKQGYEIKVGKHIAFKGKEQKKFIRLRSLGDEYQEDYIRGIIGGKKEHKPHKRVQQATERRISLVIELQTAINQKKGKGYERWAESFNLKQFAKTMNYLTENKLLRYDDLEAKSNSICNEFSTLTNTIKSAEKRMTELSILQKNIVQFAKTKETYDAYKKSGYSPKFKEANITKILLHQGAKKHFIDLELKKLPKMQALKLEYDNLLIEKKKAYSSYHDVKKEKQEVLNAKQNVEALLDTEKNASYQVKKKDQQSL